MDNQNAAIAARQKPFLLIFFDLNRLKPTFYIR